MEKSSHIKEVVPKTQSRMQEKIPSEAKRPTQGTLNLSEAERGIGNCYI